MALTEVVGQTNKQVDPGKACRGPLQGNPLGCDCVCTPWHTLSFQLGSLGVD